MTPTLPDRVAARYGCVVAQRIGPMSFKGFLQHYGGRGVWLVQIGAHITRYEHGRTPVHSRQQRLAVKAAYRITPKPKAGTNAH